MFQLQQLIVLAFFAVVAIGQADAAEYYGTGQAKIDGDDIEVCVSSTCTRIRLCGIDTPEAGCPAYDEARLAVQTLVEGKQVRCLQVGGGTVCDRRSKSTNRNRVVAQCF